MSNATPPNGLLPADTARARMLDRRLELAYITSQLTNVLDLLDAREALLREVAVDVPLEWTDFEATCRADNAGRGEEALAACHRLIGEVLGI